MGGALQAGGVGGDQEGGPDMMDNLVTFAAVAGPLAVWMIVISGAEMLIERRGRTCSRSPTSSEKSRKKATT